MTNLDSKLYEQGELLIEEGKPVRNLFLMHMGAGHLYKSTNMGDEKMRVKVVTLKIGGWFGDYQILLDLPSTWDLEAGGDKEFNPKHRIKNIPPNHIMVYMIESERFKDIIN